MNPLNIRVIRRFRQMAGYLLMAPLTQAQVKQCAIFGQPDPNFVQKYRARIDYVNSGQSDHESQCFIAVSQGWTLLEILIGNSSTDVDSQLLSGRVETTITLCSDLIQSALSLGISADSAQIAQRILEKMSPYTENVDPIWAPLTPNVGLLTRVSEALPDLQIMRDPHEGDWLLYRGHEERELARSQDFGHMLADALTRTKSDTHSHRKRD